MSYHHALLLPRGADRAAIVNGAALWVCEHSVRLIVLGSPERLDEVAPAVRGLGSGPRWIHWMPLPAPDSREHSSAAPPETRVAGRSVPALYIHLGMNAGDGAQLHASEQAVVALPAETDLGLVCLYARDELGAPALLEMLGSHSVCMNLDGFGGFDWLHRCTARRATDPAGDVLDALTRTDRLRMLGELCAGVAHEVGNPLQLMASAVQKLHRRLEGTWDEGRDYTSIILEQVRRMDGLLRSLRDLTGNRPVERRHDDVQRLVVEVCEFVRPECERRGMELGIETSPVPAFGHWDTGGIRQIVLNLLINALEALHGTADGAIGVRIRVADRDVTIEVSNNGPSIPEKQMRELFRPFTTSKPQGTGLGLYLSRRIAQSEGGDIRVRNLGERGVTFELWLPLSADDGGGTEDLAAAEKGQKTKTGAPT